MGSLIGFAVIALGDSRVVFDCGLMSFSNSIGAVFRNSSCLAWRILSLALFSSYLILHRHKVHFCDFPCSYSSSVAGLLTWAKADICALSANLVPKIGL